MHYGRIKNLWCTVKKHKNMISFHHFLPLFACKENYMKLSCLNISFSNNTWINFQLYKQIVLHIPLNLFDNILNFEVSILKGMTDFFHLSIHNLFSSEVIKKWIINVINYLDLTLTNGFGILHNFHSKN